MHVRDEDFVDTLHLHFELPHLHLGALTTINQKQFVVNIQYLCRWTVFARRCSCTAAQYGRFENHKKKTVPKVRDGSINRSNNYQC